MVSIELSGPGLLWSCLKHETLILYMYRTYTKIYITTILAHIGWKDNESKSEHYTKWGYHFKIGTRG